MNNKEIADSLLKKAEELKALAEQIKNESGETQSTTNQTLAPEDTIHVVPPRNPTREPRDKRSLIG